MVSELRTNCRHDDRYRRHENDSAAVFCTVCEIERLQSELQTERGHRLADNAEAREEIERFRGSNNQLILYRDHHEFVIRQLSELIGFNVSVVDDVVKEFERLRVELEQLKRVATDANIWLFEHGNETDRARVACNLNSVLCALAAKAGGGGE